MRRPHAKTLLRCRHMPEEVVKRGLIGAMISIYVALHHLVHPPNLLDWGAKCAEHDGVDEELKWCRCIHKTGMWLQLTEPITLRTRSQLSPTAPHQTHRSKLSHTTHPSTQYVPPHLVQLLQPEPPRAS